MFIIQYSITLVLLLGQVHIGFGQDYADKNYYLVDSLLVEELPKADLLLVDSCLKLFHKAQYDTTKINALNSILDGTSNNEMREKYNKWMCAYVVNMLEAKPTKPIIRYCLTVLAKGLNSTGYFIKRKGNLSGALNYYHKSLALFEELENLLESGTTRVAKQGISNCYNFIGGVYWNQGDLARCLEYYHKSLLIDEEIGYKRGISMSLNNLGYVYSTQDDIEKALEYYQKAIKIENEIDDKIGLAMTLNNIGIIYDDKGERSKAIHYYRRSYITNEAIGNKAGMALSLNNIGYIHRNQDNLDSALFYYQASLEIREELKNAQGISYSLYNIGCIYFVRKNIKEAKQIAGRCLQISNQLGSPRHITDAASLLSRIAKQEGNYKEALEMYELHILMRDSIKNERTQKATIRQQTKYEFEKAQLVKEQEEKEAARIVAEETSRRDNLQYSFILLGLLVLGSLVLGLGKLALPVRMAEGLIFFAFLIFFEFILVLADPYVEDWTGGAPGYKLLFNAVLAALIFPLHALFETKLKKRLAK